MARKIRHTTSPTTATRTANQSTSNMFMALPLGLDGSRTISLQGRQPAHDAATSYMVPRELRPNV